MTPALKSYVYFERHPNGVLFRKGGDTFVLRAPGSYPFVSRLLDLLDGRHALATIEARTPPKLKPLLAILVRELSVRGYLVDRGSGEQTSTLLFAAHAATLSYLTDCVPDAAARFEHWHRTPIVIGGSGLVLVAAVEALTGLGASELRVHLDPAAGDDETKSRLAQVHAVSIAAAMPAVATALYAADRLDSRHATDFCAAIAAQMIAGRINGRVIMAAGNGLVPSHLASLVHAPDEAIDPTRAQLALAGDMLAYEWFRCATGVIVPSVELEGKRIEPELSVHPLFDLPVEELATDRELSDFERFWESMKPLFDPATGLFVQRREGELLQVPLIHQEIEVRLLGAAQRRLVQGWGLGLADASRRALRLALEARTEVGHDADALARAGFAPGEARARLDAALRFLNAQRGGDRGTALDPATLENDALVLWRLAQAMAPKPLALRAYAYDDAFAVTVHHAPDGLIWAWAAEPTREDALIEALGEYCSKIQRGSAAGGIPAGNMTPATFQPDPQLGALGLHIALADAGNRTDVAA